MGTYRVHITETVSYFIEVEADTAEEAEETAEEMFVQSEDTGSFFYCVNERSGVATKIENPSNPA